MKWPRGRYNRARISGVRLVFVLDILNWHLSMPNFRYQKCLWVGPLRLWIQPEYDMLGALREAKGATP